jgi:hypothetical protein
MMQPPKGNYPGKMEARVKFQRQSLDKPIVQLSGRMEAMPVFYLTDESAGKVIGGQVDLRKYQNEIEENSGGEAIELKNVTLRLNINFKDRMQTVSPNVAGYLPGEHPDKREELLIIGAHYDHLGSNDSQIFYGADDNASGVAGLLYLAEAFTQAERKPERSLLFIAFSAEEEGTLGSLYYTLNPLFPLENTVAMINLDGIGRNGAPSMGEMRSAKNFSLWDKYVMVLYSGQSPELAELNQKHHHKTGLEIDLDPNLRFFGSSDQMNFHNCGIPSLFYFTGFHPDYHTPNDTAEKLNYPKMVKILDLVYNVADEILNKKGRLKYDPGAQIPAKKSRMNF